MCPDWTMAADYRQRTEIAARAKLDRVTASLQQSAKVLVLDRRERRVVEKQGKGEKLSNTQFWRILVRYFSTTRDPRFSLWRPPRTGHSAGSPGRVTHRAASGYWETALSSNVV